MPYVGFAAGTSSLETDDPAPLDLIEERVRVRAGETELDARSPEGASLLRQLIRDEVLVWQEDHRRGLRPPIADPDLVELRAWRNLAGYGPLEEPPQDEDVWEIMINAPDAIFVKRHRGPSGYHHEVFRDDDHVLRILTRIFEDAAISHRKLDPSEGIQDAHLPDGSRVHVVHADLTRGGHVCVNIRRFTGVAFRTLDDVAAAGMFDTPTADLLRAAVRARCSVVVSGQPGSGKTTLLSCLLGEVDPALRVVTAEAVFEIDVPLPNFVSLQTRPALPERPEIDLRRLVSAFLRMAPDVAVVGEVRDREALPLLLTLSSGVTGFTTIHAPRAGSALMRLRLLAQLSEAARQIPFGALNSLVA
ncbi:MAG: pilus assembly protein CpaF [Acidimicrobiales bacterium]|nr:MAG: pilus assembly protein CpaF [Acidimicrobiales bacterium]